MVERRVIVVGAGPAGTRCAQTLAAAGLRPILIDENRRDGGQIYRRQPEGFRRSYENLYGSEAARAADVHRAFDALRERIDYRAETLVWNVADGHVHTVQGSRQAALPFDALVLCTGATDRLMPVRGWNLAGTYTLGGAQVALKSQACAIGRSIVFMGTGALLYLVAAQYAKAGAHVAAVLDCAPRSLRAAAMGKLLAMPGTLWRGLLLELELRRRSIHMYGGVEPIAIEGNPDKGVAAVSFKDAGGRDRRIACDAVALGYHLRPETQLADLARCEFRFDDATRQWLPRIDDAGRSSVRGVYLAGDGGRILGANAAEICGRLAAQAVLEDFQLAASPPDSGLRVQLAKLQRFASGLAQAFPWPWQQAGRLSDDTIVCRCESITAGELRRVVRESGAHEANRAKAFSRVGMGRCQGRYCGHAAAEVIAQAANVPLESVGRLRGQAPVKPLPVALQEAE